MVGEPQTGMPDHSTFELFAFSSYLLLVSPLLDSISTAKKLDSHKVWCTGGKQVADEGASQR
jgi:hypothetical protein